MPEFDLDKYWIKIIPVILSIILIGLFIPYIGSFTEPIEVEVITEVPATNFGVNITHNNFNVTLINNFSISDTFELNYDKFGTATATTTHATSVQPISQAFYVPKDCELDNITLAITILPTCVLNITVYNATINGTILKDTKIHEYVTPAFPVLINSDYTFSDLNFTLNTNNTQNNTFILQFISPVSSARLGYYSTANLIDYADTYKNDILLEGIDFGFNLTFVNTNTSAFIDRTNIVNLESTILSLHNETIRIQLLNASDFLLYTQYDLDFFSLEMTGTTNMLSTYDFSTMDDQNYYFQLNNSYTFNIINHSIYLNEYDLYYDRFTVYHRWALNISNTVIYANQIEELQILL